MLSALFLSIEQELCVVYVVFIRERRFGRAYNCKCVDVGAKCKVKFTRTDASKRVYRGASTATSAAICLDILSA